MIKFKSYIYTGIQISISSILGVFCVEQSDLFVSQPSLAGEVAVHDKRILARFGDIVVRFF